MLEALRISSDIPALLPVSERGNVVDLDKAAVQPKLIELLQVSFIKAYAVHFTIFDEHFISVHIKRLFRRPVNYWVDLRCVEPMPVRVFTIDRPSMWVSATLTLLSTVFLLVAWLSVSPLLWFTVAAPLLCSALIAALIMAQRSKNRVQFFSRYGRIPWFELLVDKPRRRTVEAFIETITSTIIKAKNNPVNNQNDGNEGSLGAELREHRKLMEGGIISERDYNSVKSRLLRQHSAKES
jgi:hypothetical protein